MTFPTYAARNWSHPPRLLRAGAAQHILYRGATVNLFVTPAGVAQHRSVVHRRDFRFPFMSQDDLMIGAVWTAPEMRGLGLASTMLTMILQSTPCSGRYWYVTEAHNRASVGVAQKNGFECVGRGRKVPRLGRSELGSYVLAQRTTND
ncbi:GNAT family N-acetyltransferase [Nocardioides hungaricus]